jgi:hypothetical protein
MKSKIIAFLFLLYVSAYGQIQVIRTDGGAVVTNLGYNIQVNKGSTLKREWITLNDTTCPIQFNGSVGITTSYAERSYSFNASGTINPKEPIVAYEVLHVLYDMFGEHIKTLSNKKVIDINSSVGFENPSWYGSETQISQFLFCVTFVSNVRTAKGVIWRYNPQPIKEELNKIKIQYEAGYEPSKVTEK